MSWVTHKYQVMPFLNNKLQARVLMFHFIFISKLHLFTFTHMLKLLNWFGNYTLKILLNL